LANLKCSVCGGDVPGEEQNTPGEPICPACATQHFMRKTQRIKVLKVLLAMYGLKEEDVDAATLDRIAKDYYRKLEAGEIDESGTPTTSPPLET
jgi:hypothetical protein